jgi:hypothetical protein
MLSLKTLASVRRLNLPGAMVLIGAAEQVTLTSPQPAPAIASGQVPGR